MIAWMDSHEVTSGFIGIGTGVIIVLVICLIFETHK
jgi:hypothetical protein